MAKETRLEQYKAYLLAQDRQHLIVRHAAGEADPAFQKALERCKANIDEITKVPVSFKGLPNGS